MSLFSRIFKKRKEQPIDTKRQELIENLTHTAEIKRQSNASFKSFMKNYNSMKTQDEEKKHKIQQKSIKSLSKRVKRNVIRQTKNKLSGNSISVNFRHLKDRKDKLKTRKQLH